jgi:hypothetical protein
VPAVGAWIDPSTLNGKDITNSGIATSGRQMDSPNCFNWTDGGNVKSGHWLEPSGHITSGKCDSSHAVACCY